MIPLSIIALVLAVGLIALIALLVAGVQALRLLHWALLARDDTPAARPRLTGALLALLFSTLAAIDLLPFNAMTQLSDLIPLPLWWRETAGYFLLLMALTVLSWLYGNRAKDWAWRRIRGESG